MPDTNVSNAYQITPPITGRVSNVPAPRSALHPDWLDKIGVSAATIAYAQESVRLLRGSLLARHRDKNGHILGWESVGAPRHEGGKPRYGYTTGACRGLYWTPLGLCTRVVVGAGPLQILQTATREGPRAGTCYVAPGGVLNDVAEETLAELLRRGSARQRGLIDEIVLAVGSDVQGTRTSERIHALVGRRFPWIKVMQAEALS